MVWKLSGQATRCSESLESHRIPAACISLVLVVKANVEGEHPNMLEDYLCTRYRKTSGFFQCFWEGTGRSNGFLNVFIIHCRLPMAEIRLPMTLPFILSPADECGSQVCWRGHTFLRCKIPQCIGAGPLRLCFQKKFKLV